MIVMMFNSLLLDVVTMTTNHSDLVKPKLLSDFKIFQSFFVSVMHLDFTSLKMNAYSGQHTIWTQKPGKW